MNRWIKLSAVFAVAAIVAGLTGGAGATNAPTRAASADSKEVARSAASTAAARRGVLLLQANLETVAGVKRYLRAIGVNPRGVVIQRGVHNYAGPSCPGAGWSCTSTAHPVVQVGRRGGQNRFVCASRSCAVVQATAAVSRKGRALAAVAASQNTAQCVKTTPGVTQTCSISQTGATADNTAVVFMDLTKASGLTQSAVYTAQITQQQAAGSSGANKACVHQAVSIDGSTTAKKSQSVNVNIQSHQSITITQDSFAGGNRVANAINPSNGVYKCDDSPNSALTQSETLTSLANGAGSITQNLDAPDNGPNLKLDIAQNQSPGFFQNASATGPNNALFSQETKQTAIANTSAGPVTQVQSSESGGILAKVNQWSKGVSKADATQTETQCEHAAASGATACTQTGAGAGSGTPSNTRTQVQFGPIGAGSTRSRTAGRTLAKVGKGICPPDCSTQADNPANSFGIKQSSTQANDTGGNQKNTVSGDCTTSGNCTANQQTNINGQATNNTSSGQNVSLTINCIGSDCIAFDGSPGTNAPPPTLGGYPMTPFGADPQPLGPVSGVSDPAGTISFSPQLNHDRIGAGWATWSHGYTGDVYDTCFGLVGNPPACNAADPSHVTITLPAGTKAFFFYAEPNTFNVFNVQATAQDGTTSGPVQVQGDSGAKYFGFYGTGAATIASVNVTATDPLGFAVGEFGINPAAAIP